MYTPTPIADADPLMVGTYTKNGINLLYSANRASVPASGTMTANTIYLVPFFVSHGYSLARWWWQNGATVGTDYIETGIYDESFNLFRASPRTLSAGTVNQLQFASPGVHGFNITSGNSIADATTYATASVSLKAGVLYLLGVGNTHGASAHAVSSIDGGPTFASRSSTQFNGTLNRVSIWSAVPTTDYTGTLTINFGANTETNCTWVLSGYYHVDTASANGVVQQAVGTGSSTTPLATLGAFGSANNATVGIFSNSAGSSSLATTGWVELNDASNTPAMSTYFRSDNDTTADSTITSGPWGACAVEIKSLGTGAVYVPPMRGWLAFHCSSNTATFWRRTATDMTRANILIQTSATAGLPVLAVPVASTSVGSIVNHGFTRSTSP